MATLLIGLSAICFAALLGLDLIVMRGADHFDSIKPDKKDRVWQTAPPVVTGGANLSAVLGALFFPGTLAPVVITVLAFQAHPVLSDGWISLVAVVVAGLSMSVAVKCFRVHHILRHFSKDMRGLLAKTLAFQSLWVLFILLLCGLMRMPTGNLALVVWSYVLVNTVGIAISGVAIRAGLAATAESTPATQDAPT